MISTQFTYLQVCLRFSGSHRKMTMDPTAVLGMAYCDWPDGRLEKPIGAVVAHVFLNSQSALLVLVGAGCFGLLCWTVGTTKEVLFSLRIIII